MSGEIFVIIITAVVMSTAVLRTLIKAIAGGKSESPSLTRSELQQLLRETVEEGNAGLEERIRELERKVDLQLPAGNALQKGAGNQTERETASEV